MKKTPYNKILKEMGGKFVDFAGFDMPVQFDGIISEHKAVRENVGLFDVSHMGEFLFTGQGALSSLQNLLANNYENLQSGRVRYSLMLNDNGGIIDDVLVYCINSKCYLMVVNASNIDKDKQWIKQNLKENTTFSDLSVDTALLAIQGPNAIKVIEKIFNSKDIPNKGYSFTIVENILKNTIILSRTGYTAEDGFEIYCNVTDAMDLLNKVLDAGADFNLALCGLGARDTLRLEGGMPLYGHEMNEDILASETGLNMFIKVDKPSFVGKQALISNSAKMQRLGVCLVDRGIAREGSVVFDGENKIGYVTSGTHSPTLNKAIAMIRVNNDFTGNEVTIEVRGRRLKAEVCSLPFYKRINK